MSQAYNKAWAALIMSLLQIAELLTGVSMASVSEEVILGALALITPIVVWAIPNR